MNPYLIYAPNWRNNAAGIKVLYFLCDTLNKLGAEAYIVPVGFSCLRKLPNLEIKYLKKKNILDFGKRNVTPIVVYSETILGNPLNAKNYVKYVMNYPGILGVQARIGNEEILLPYSYNIEIYLKEKFPNNKVLNKLFIPPFKISELQQSEEKQDFYLEYLGKFQDFQIETNIDFSSLNTVKIRRRGLRAQKRSHVLQLLSRAKGLICYENSAIINEAIILGTPTILIETSLSKNPIAEKELTNIGIYTSLVEAENNFNQNIHQEALVIYSNAEIASSMLAAEFIKLTQEMLIPDPHGNSIAIQNRLVRTIRHKFTLANGMRKTNGMRSVTRYLAGYLK